MTFAERLAEVKDTDGNIRWPGVERDRLELCRELFGLALVDQIDRRYETAADVVVNPASAKQWPRQNEAYHRDRAARAAFATMSDEQRDATLRLVREGVLGTVFDLLVTVDQWPATGAAEVALVDQTVNGQPSRIPVTPEGEGLHDLLWWWVADHSRFADAFFRRVPQTHGTGVFLDLR